MSRAIRHRFWIALAGIIAITAAIWVWLAARQKLDLASVNRRHTWQPVVLMPWARYGYDFGGVRGASSDPRIDAWFSRLQRDGMKAVAWFLFGDGRASLIFNASGQVSGLAPGFLADYHDVLKLARKHRLQVIWVLTDFEIGMPAETADGVHMFGHADLLEDEAKRASLIRNALVPLLRDRENSSQIAGWIVINEPEQLLRSGRVTESAIRSLVQEASAAIKQYHPKQRVGLANSDIAAMIEFADLDTLDFLVFHHYRATLPPPAAFIEDYIRKRLRRARPRPIFIGEFNLNFPPGSNLDRFVRTARDFGYAGVWPWSLRNRADASGTAAIEVEPQFTETGSYARSIGTAAGDDRTLQDWATNQLRLSLLPSVEQRISRLARKSEYRQAKAEANLEWVRRENKLELDWLQALKQELGDEQALQRALSNRTEAGSRLVEPEKLLPAFVVRLLLSRE